MSTIVQSAAALPAAPGNTAIRTAAIASTPTIASSIATRASSDGCSSFGRALSCTVHNSCALLLFFSCGFAIYCSCTLARLSGSKGDGSDSDVDPLLRVSPAASSFTIHTIHLRTAQRLRVRRRDLDACMSVIICERLRVRRRDLDVCISVTPPCMRPSLVVELEAVRKWVGVW